MKRYFLGFTVALALCIGCSPADQAVEIAEPTSNSDVDLAQHENMAHEPQATEDANDSTVDAAQLLAATLADAKANDKQVLVHLGAPWCGWCSKLEDFFASNPTLFEEDYILLKIDVEKMQKGEEVAKQLRGDREGGIPWMTILNADGEEMVSSDGPDGNIGCPMSPDEQSYFISMIDKTRRHAPEAITEELSVALKEFAAK